MSFRRYGGIQYSAKHNIVSSNYNTCNYLSVTETVGQPNSYINFASDISGHIIGPTGTSTNDNLWSLNNNVISATGTTNSSGPTVRAYSFNSVADCSINSMTLGHGGGNVNSNAAFGIDVLKLNTTGIENVGVGFNALYSNSTGKDNIGIGYNTLSNNTIGNDNIGIGFEALLNNTSGGSNVALGNATLINNNGDNNVGIGVNSLESNLTGSNNVGVGVYSLRYNSSGQNNIGIGFSSFENDVSGSYNVGVGDSAGSTLLDGSNNICIGYNAQPSTTTISNEITLGNSSITTLRCEVNTITSISDARDKKEIVSLSGEQTLNFVEKLNPVSFKWNMRNGAKVDVPDTGFIAQELQLVQEETKMTIPNLVYDVNPDRLEASYGTLIPILVSAIKELSAKVKALEERI